MERKASRSEAWPRLVPIFDGAAASVNGGVPEEGHPPAEPIAVLTEISGAVSGSLNPQAVMQEAAQATARLLGVQEACIWVYEAGSGVLRLGARVPDGDGTSDVSLPSKGSICGSVLRSRQPFVTHRLTQHPLWKPRLPYSEDPESGLFIPFYDRGRPLGVLVALSARERAFGDEDVRLVQALAAQVAVAIQNARLNEDARLRARQLATILDVNKRLALRPNLEEMLSRITEEATRLLGAEAAGLRLVEGDELVRAASFGAAATLMVRERLRLGESLSGRVAKENRAIVSTDLADDTRLTPLHRTQPRSLGIRAWLGVPLRGPERVVGVLFVSDRRRRRFAPADIRLLEAFADQAALAIENARLFRQEQERHQQLEVVREVMAEITRELDLTTVLELTVRRAAELVGAAGGVVHLWDEASEVLMPRALHGLGEWAGTLRVRLGEGVTGIVGQRREGIIVNDYGSSPYAHAFFLEQSGAVAVLAEPILYQGRLVGVITVSNEGSGRQFTEQHRQLLRIFADGAAIAIENARLYQQLGERERRLHELVARLLVAQEEERRRVAYDVHDGLAQVAAAAQQHLEAFASRHRPRSPRGREALGRARELAQRTVGEARRVIADLRPTALDDFGLAAAFRMDVEALVRDGWQITYAEDLGPERLPPAMETAVYRVGQEALTNVRKHAETTRVHLALRRRGRAIHLEIRDWGRGFQPSAVLAGAGPSGRVGVAGMRERVAWLGGRCAVRSRPGAGTRIVVEIPLPIPDEGPSPERSP